MRYQKGQSGNPGGRPKVDPGVREALRAKTPRAVERLGELLESEDEEVALKAAIHVLDRNLGKPMQSVKKTVTHVKKSPRDLTLEELEQRLTELTAPTVEEEGAAH